MISIKAARRAAVPLVVIETADPQQTILNIAEELNGKKTEIPLMQWDICRSLSGLNQSGGSLANKVTDGNPVAAQNPAECLTLLATKIAEEALVFFHNAQLFWPNETVRQGIWNLRDIFKGSGSMLVLLCPNAATLPDELKADCIVLTDSLPTLEEVGKIVDSIIKDAKLDSVKAGDREKITDALLGLPAFTAEQVLAMSVTKEGIDQPALWERKRRMIEQTPGLSVWRGGETFSDVGGYENVKKFMRSICNGQAAPKAIVFIDEIEKSMAGSHTDSTGVSQDYLRTLLTFMQDKRASGVIFIGPPGSGKSMVAKASGNEAGIPTIAFDMGGMKGSLVGQSEQRIRTALSVADAISQGALLFVATCNSIGILPPEMRRRFSLGIFFFPLPSLRDCAIIWSKKLKRYGLKSQPVPEHSGWTGAEIENCCTIAWRLGVSLKEAAGYVVPVSVSAKDQIEKLCSEAHQRYINAAEPGLFSYLPTALAPIGKRKFATIKEEL